MCYRRKNAHNSTNQSVNESHPHLVLVVLEDQLDSLSSHRRHGIVILYKGECNVQAVGGDLMELREYCSGFDYTLAVDNGMEMQAGE